MNDKKAFEVHFEWEEIFNSLTDEQLGDLVLVIFKFSVTGIVPEIKNPIVAKAFSQIKDRMVNDMKSY